MWTRTETEERETGTCTSTLRASGSLGTPLRVRAEVTRQFLRDVDTNTVRLSRSVRPSTKSWVYRWQRYSEVYGRYRSRWGRLGPARMRDVCQTAVDELSPRTRPDTVVRSNGPSEVVEKSEGRQTTVGANRSGRRPQGQ